MMLAAMRRIAIFVDGASRAALLPFGPILIRRLLVGESGQALPSAEAILLASDDASFWPSIAWPMAILVATFSIGQSIGSVFVGYSSLVQRSMAASESIFYRIVGIYVALHFFSYGSGLRSYQALLCARFFGAMTSGMLRRIARISDDDNNSPTTTGGPISQTQPSTNSALNIPSFEQQSCLDVSTGNAKIWLSGFAVSVLSSGLLFQPLSGSAIFRALTGGYIVTLSPLFFASLVAATECMLRRCCAACLPLVERGAADDNCKNGTKKESAEGTVKKLTSGLLSGVMKRRRRRSAVEDSSPFLPMQSENNDNHGNRLRNNSVDEKVEFFDLPSNNRQWDVPFAPHRNRADSSRSDEFFDCSSVLDEEEFFAGDAASSSHLTGKTNYTESDIAEYRDGQCLYSDGSPADVPSGECSPVVPRPYLDFNKGNNAKAAQMWEETQRWRREQAVWKIHRTPHPFFPKIKEAYPHFVHGYTKTGLPVVYERPGKMNLKQLFRNGCDVSDMVRHYIYFMEYISNCVWNRPEVQDVVLQHRNIDGGVSTEEGRTPWGFVVVMDIKGASLTTLSGDVLRYLKQASDVNSAHYPNSMRRAITVNSPFWLAGAWSSIKGILPESVQVDFLSSSNLSGLEKYIDLDQIPREYGGASPYPLGQHPFELDLLAQIQISDSSNTAEGSCNTGIENTLDGISTSSLNETDRPADGASSIPENHHRGRRRSTLAQIQEDTAPQSTCARATTRTLMSDDEMVFENVPLAIEGGSENDSWAHEYVAECGSKISIPRMEDWHYFDETYVLVIVSVMHGMWCAIFGALEMGLPLWMLSPAIIGGLGYETQKSGVSLFCACVVLMWLTRTKVAKIAAKIPSRSPMRAYRIGTGAVGTLLAILAIVPALVTSVAKKDSVLVMTSTIIVLSSLMVASFLGRSAAAILHQVASEAYAASRPVRNEAGQVACHCWRDKVSRACRNDCFTKVLGIGGETVGSMVVAPLFGWSTLQQRPFPFDGACILCIASLFSWFLYVLSFSLHVNSSGNFAPHPLQKRDEEKGNCTSCNKNSWFAFVGEVFAVSVSDMASLFEESNWTSSPVLGFSRAESQSPLLPTKGEMVGALALSQQEHDLAKIV